LLDRSTADRAHAALTFAKAATAVTPWVPGRHPQALRIVAVSQQSISPAPGLAALRTDSNDGRRCVLIAMNTARGAAY
jgi:hypothetical protein